jgi:hypothetical protein
MLTLTQITAQVQAMFIDDGTRFTAATVTAACRQALKDFNAASPAHAAETQDVVSGQYDYELTDMSCVQVLDVLLEGTDTLKENHIPLAFTPYFEDNRAWIRLQVPLGSGQLIFRYLTLYTVSGLDAGAQSTLPALFDAVLLDGCCYYACVIRAASRIEVVNLNSDVPDPWEKIAQMYRQAFDTGLQLARQQAAPRVPDKIYQPRTWQDEWHNFSP